jgi:hypothetical protein
VDLVHLTLNDLHYYHYGPSRPPHYLSSYLTEGIDYEGTFAPVARYTSIRTIIALAAKMKWKLHQMDVKTTFLNGVIEEEMYIEQPQGFEVEDKKSYVC